MSLKFKFISALTVAGASLVFAGASLAQDTNPTTPQGDKTEHHHRGDGQGRRGPGGREGFGRHGGFMMGGLMKDVNLTDAQKAQIKQIREANKPDPTQFEQIRTLMKAKRDGTITADQQAQLKAFHEARKAKEASVRQQIEAIFTPDQKAQIEKNKADMKARREEFKQKREEWRKNHQNGAPATTTPAKPGTAN
jgi:protein CpxP